MGCPECSTSVDKSAESCQRCGHTPPVLRVAGLPDRAFRLWPGRYVIGRTRDCDIPLADSSISRRHASVVAEDGRYTIEDLGSVNGTFVEGVRTKRSQLTPGNLVQLGAVTLRFELEPVHSTLQTVDVHARALTSRSPRQRAAAEQALDRLAMGVVLVGPQGEVAFMNRSARNTLERGDGLKLAAGSLQALDPSAMAPLRRLLMLGPSDPRSAGEVTVLRGGKAPLTVLVAQLAAGSHSAGSTALKAVFIGDPEQGTDVSPQMLRRLYSLTPAEARMSRELLMGRSLEQAATAMDISLHTARTHLKRIFSKTGTRRQAELVRLLLSGPGQIRED